MRASAPLETGCAGPRAREELRDVPVAAAWSAARPDLLRQRRGPRAQTMQWRWLDFTLNMHARADDGTAGGAETCMNAPHFPMPMPTPRAGFCFEMIGAL